MKQRSTAKRESRSPAAGAAREPGPAVPALPAWKAFVVQFTREAGKEVGVFAGRVEHLSSGRRKRFGNAEELVEILEGFLAEAASPVA